MKNTFNPTHPGTLIVHRSDSAPSSSVIKAVTASQRTVSMMTVSGSGLKGVPGIAGRTFMAVARTNTSVLMISQASAEQNICFVIPKAAAPSVVAELSAEFRQEMEHGEINPIETFDEASIITAVGALGISETPGVSGRVFSALGAQNINVFAIAQGVFRMRDQHDRGRRPLRRSGARRACADPMLSGLAERDTPMHRRWLSLS
ncbi:MAG: hypothetical protein KatS3mg052_0657 [Candidatus Roseilinea sp.]|nr:MAG: hypothetical protein KatS3mg052_0657 [Candidatus Roseilinea sp.]